MKLENVHIARSKQFAFYLKTKQTPRKRSETLKISLIPVINMNNSFCSCVLADLFIKMTEKQLSGHFKFLFAQNRFPRINRFFFKTQQG